MSNVIDAPLNQREGFVLAFFLSEVVRLCQNSNALLSKNLLPSFVLIRAAVGIIITLLR